MKILTECFLPLEIRGVWRSGCNPGVLCTCLEYEGGAAGEIRQPVLGRLNNFKDLMECANS